MSVLPIVTYDDAMLRQKAAPVTENTDALQTLIDNMFETMYNAAGVGLAAPQVAEPKRLFVMDADPMAEEAGEPKYGAMVIINPKIISKKEVEVTLDEGCLSIPGVNAPVDRPEKITVTYLDRNFNEQRLEAEGWMARIIQHETDHLDGVLFLDYLSFFKRKLFGTKLNKIASGESDVDYPTAPKELQVQ